MAVARRSVRPCLWFRLCPSAGCRPHVDGQATRTAAGERPDLAEGDLGEAVKDHVIGRVVGSADFLQDDVFLAFQFLFVEDAVGQDVGENIDRDGPCTSAIHRYIGRCSIRYRTRALVEHAVQYSRIGRIAPTHNMSRTVYPPE